jgi:hypothetical protein
VAVIEAVTPKDLEGMKERYGGEGQDFAVFRSAVRFIDGSTKLAVQSVADITRLAKGRVLPMAAGLAESGKRVAKQIVPVDAIRHFERISDEERAAMSAAYGGGNPEAIAAKRTRIVYRGLDPSNPKRYFQKTFEADVLDNLMDQDSAFVIDIGNGKFVLADEIEDARPLSERELARLSRKYALKARTGEALTTSIVLTGGEFILSSRSAEAIEALVERPLPSLHGAEAEDAVAEADEAEPQPAV